jgi:two-component system sensor histidine kinase TctE
MAARSLRAHLLRMLLPPIAALLLLGALVAYYPSIEPATAAYDQGLIDIGISLGTYVRPSGPSYRLELPAAVEQVLRRDSYDSVYYQVLGPDGEKIAGDDGLPEPPPGAAGMAIIAYDTQYKSQSIRAVSVPAQCGNAACRVLVAETTVKRKRLARDILFSTLLPEMLIAVATVIIVWFGVKRGLAPLARLSEEIKTRSPGDLRPVDAAGSSRR